MNIGIVLPHIGNAQISYYAIKAINNAIAQSREHDFVLFFEQITTPVIKPDCGTMCVNELMLFQGTLITTTLANTAMAISQSSRKANKIIYYVWDLEWLRPNKNNYLENFKTFNLASELVARSTNHAKAIQNYCNRQVSRIIPEFNLAEIIQ
jgi:hypothetical protein